LGRVPSIELCNIRGSHFARTSPGAARTSGLPEREPPPELVRLHAVDGDALAVELEHRQPFPVAPLELRLAGDVDLDELEAEFGPQRLELLAGALAEVAVATDVKDEGAQG
jgi:hypothetical protein